MVQTVGSILVFLVLLLAIPYIWPDSFSEPPVVMVVLLALAAVVALIIGRRRRARGWDGNPRG